MAPTVAKAMARQAVPGEFNLKVHCIMCFRAAITSKTSLSPMMIAICFQTPSVRWRSGLIENDAYLMQLSYYINENPLRAGIVRRLIDYRWSSYPAYAYNRRHPEGIY